MKTISCLNDLKEYGIYPLTGEADALGYRILCDVDKRGKELIEDTFGVQCGTAPWNISMAGGREHVASVMLTHRAAEDIGPIALLGCCHTVLQVDDGRLFGFEDDEEYRAMDGGGEYRQREEWCLWPMCYGKPQRTFERSWSINRLSQ